MSPETPLPDSCAVAFKEWAGVCAALGSGRQSLIFRKGGIAEGPGGFVPEHPAFWLYPTHLHEAQQGLRIEPPADTAAPPREGFVGLRSLVTVEHVAFVDRADRLAPLEEFHVWTEETVRKRFEYRRPGLWVLAIRAFNRPKPIELRVTAEHAGCKTWVVLDAPIATAGLRPALDADEASRRLDRLLRALGPTA